MSSYYWNKTLTLNYFAYSISPHWVCFPFFNWMKTIKVAVLQFETEITLIKSVSWWPKADNSSDRQSPEGEGGTFSSPAPNCGHARWKTCSHWKILSLVREQSSRISSPFCLANLGTTAKTWFCLQEQPIGRTALWLTSTGPAGTPAAVGTFLQQKRDVFAGPCLFAWEHIFPHAERKTRAKQNSCLPDPRDCFMVLCFTPSGSRKLCFSKRDYFLWTQQMLWPGIYGSRTEQLLAPSSAPHACSQEVLRTKDQLPLKCEAREQPAVFSLPLPRSGESSQNQYFETILLANQAFFFQI